MRNLNIKLFLSNRYSAINTVDIIDRTSYYYYGYDKIYVKFLLIFKLHIAKKIREKLYDKFNR